ncbi:MAG: hypothetical protein ACKOTB_13750 [Planctomycetia bacterium]
MTSLERRLFHLFEPAAVARARTLSLTRVWCPRVGQVQARISDEEGEELEVKVELSARRKGGMTLETRSTSEAGRSGMPCAALAAVILEIDRRRLFSNLHDHTPLSLDVVADDDHEPKPSDDESPADEPPDDADRPASPRSAPPTMLPAEASATARRGSARLPNWAAELEDRRRLVEPAVRDRMVALPDPRKATGALVFLLDLAASADTRAAVLLPGRIQVDVTGNATGRPKPVVIGPGDVDLAQLDPQERSILAQLIGAAAVGETGVAEPLERRTIARVIVSPESAATHLALLCETGRLLMQPEPRRHPDLVVPLVWDGGRPWEFALVIEPGDSTSPRVQTLADLTAEDVPPPTATPTRPGATAGSPRDAAPPSAPPRPAAVPCRRTAATSRSHPARRRGCGARGCGGRGR